MTNALVELLFEEDKLTLKDSVAEELFKFPNGLPEKERMFKVLYTIAGTDLSTDLEFLEKHVFDIPMIRVFENISYTEEMFNHEVIIRSLIELLKDETLGGDGVQYNESLTSYVLTQFDRESISKLYRMYLENQKDYLQLVFSNQQDSYEGILERVKLFNTISCETLDKEIILEEYPDLFILPIIAESGLIGTFDLRDLHNSKELMVTVTPTDLDLTTDSIVDKETDGTLTGSSATQRLMMINELRIKLIKNHQVALSSLIAIEESQEQEDSEE